MLAKLCSRLVRDPTSLVAQVLRGHYFPHNSLLTSGKVLVPLGAGPVFYMVEISSCMAPAG
ncbi:hypothetical protein LINGRAHAP2_LOCUS1934 [Linum grandiflorum]